MRIKTERFEFRTTSEFMQRIDRVRGKKSRAEMIEELCERALKTLPAPSLELAITNS